jgi:Tol biopolymer transport system component
MKNRIFTAFCAVFGLFGCSQTTPEPILFGPPYAVTVAGYPGSNLMEPFFSRDGKYLLFNNLNSAPEDTNLYWATRKDDKTFEYKGEVIGVATTYIEGTPSMDKLNNLYFVSTRKYDSTLSTIYVASFKDGVASNVILVEGISKKQAGIVNFDVEVNASGSTLYFVDGEFDKAGRPVTADIVIAKKTTNGFERMPTSADIMKNINTSQLEYAASISSDDLDIYFTRVSAPIDQNSIPAIYVASRKNVDEPFDQPVLLQGLGNFIEAPSISNNGKLLYYHGLQGSLYKLFLVKH